jgi:hypothetical protein
VLGISILVNTQFSKQDGSITSNRDWLLNIVFLIVELKKHDEPSGLIEQGMQIDPIEEFGKHVASSHVKLDSTSTSIVSMSQFMKHHLPIMSTDLGIQIVCNIQFAKHD